MRKFSSYGYIHKIVYSGWFCRQQILRWSIFSAITIGLFWLIWYLSEGYIPKISQIGLGFSPELGKSWVYMLPGAVTRWADILLGPITVIIFFLFAARAGLRVDNRMELFEGLAIGSFFGSLAGIGLSACVLLGEIELAPAITTNIIFAIYSWLPEGDGQPRDETIRPTMLSGLLFFNLSIGLVMGFIAWLACAFAFLISLWGSKIAWLAIWGIICLAKRLCRAMISV